jgi:hypothetical protein
MQGEVIVPLEEDSVAAGSGDALQQGGFIALKRGVVSAFTSDVIHRPGIVLVVRQPALFGFAVGTVTLRHLREGNVIPGRVGWLA